MDAKSLQINTLLLENHKSDDTEFWDWINVSNGETVDKKNANKFLLGCILDYRILAETAWKNARRLSEDILGDPDDLWGSITSVSKSQWSSKWKEYSLHRFPVAHDRVWRIGKDIVDLYEGDARNIWNSDSPSVVLNRLNEMRVGEQISRMTVGALYDTGHISGIGDVKADIHIRRVLGRALIGEVFSPDKATEITREMNSDNPWLLDRPLYLIGKNYCSATNPKCNKCYLHDECAFRNKNQTKS